MILVLVLTAGCVQQQTKYVCPDGSTVSSPSSCGSTNNLETTKTVSTPSTSTRVKTVDTEDFFLNPEKYNGQRITVNLEPATHYTVTEGLVQHEELYAKNERRREDGKPITDWVYLDYDEFYCYKCKITGLVKPIETCFCEARIKKEKDPESTWGGTGGYQYTVESCLGREHSKSDSEFRCRANTIKNSYIIEVEKVVAID